MKKNIILEVCLGIIGVLGKIILQDNFIYFVKMWLAVLVIGIAFFPFCYQIFKKFKCKGWIFSKIIGIGVTAIILWLLSYAKFVKFNILNSYVIAFVVFFASLIILRIKKEKLELNKELIKNILVSEIIFSASFIEWLFIRSFHVAIDETTEQFMDYGFMNKIFNSSYFPVEDIWLSGNKINYYYFGQYISAFLSKISFMQANEGYGVMLAFMASLTFSLPFSISYNLGENLIKEKGRKVIPYVIAIITGLSVSIGGTLHYPIYNWIIPRDSGDTYYYWESTRYIGYKPETNDKTNTEIPAYTNITNDLHAHYLDIMFVFTTLALLLELLINDEKKETKKRLLNFNILILAIILGIQKMTNYWDFPIYLVVIIVTIIANSLTKYKLEKKNVLITFAQVLEILILEELVTLPFSRDLSISATNVCFTNVTSPLYKMVVLWALPTICMIWNTILVLVEIFKNKNEKLIEKIQKVNKSDVFIVIIGCCALGLVVLPEIIYLKDIYGDEYKRFNTMFKLTYQAYIMFSISTSYILVKFAFQKENKVNKILGIIFLIIHLSTFSYGLNAINYQLKAFRTPKNYAGIDEYIKKNYRDDYNAIEWIKANLSRDEVILEAPSSAYQIPTRISVFTANPILLGWNHHEWIWRADENYESPQEVQERSKASYEIYTSASKERIIELCKMYNISYIYVGNVEPKENVPSIIEAGEIVYSQTTNYSLSPVYLVKVAK